MARAEDLWVYQSLNLLHHPSLPLAPSPSLSPTAGEPFGNSSLIRPCSSWLSPCTAAARGSTGSTVSVCCARTALPPLAHPAFHLFCLQIHAALWSWVSRSWKDEHAKNIFFFLIISQGLDLGFFSGLLYLWVESCDSVTVSPQCYKFLHGWWLYQLVVFYIHTAFSIKGVGIGFHL